MIWGCFKITVIVSCDRVGQLVGRFERISVVVEGVKVLHRRWYFVFIYKKKKRKEWRIYVALYYTLK